MSPAATGSAPRAANGDRPLPPETRAARLVFDGRGLGEPFLDFLRERACRLGLDGQAAGDDARVSATLRGPMPLIDMLLVACLLGPVECMVEEVLAEPLPPEAVPDGFTVERSGIEVIDLGRDMAGDGR